MANAHEASAQGAANRDAEINFPDLLLILNQNDIWGGVKSLRAAFRWVFLFTLMALVVLIPLSLAINATDYRAFNLVFLFALGIMGLYHALDPFKWLVFFGFGGVVNGLPNFQFDRLIPIPGREFQIPDFKLREFVEAGGQGVKFYWDVLVVVWLFFAMWFAVLATIEVNGAAVYGFMAMLLMLGIVSIRWSMSRCQLWFKRICIGIILSMTIVWGASTFLGGGALEYKLRTAIPALGLKSPQAESIFLRKQAQARKQEQEDSGRYEELTRFEQERRLTNQELLEMSAIEERIARQSFLQESKAHLSTVEAGPYEIVTLEPFMLKGIKASPGFYTLEVLPMGDIQLGESLYDLTSYVRINGVKSGDEIYIGSTGVAKLTYTLRGVGKNTRLKYSQNLYFRLKPRIL